MHPCGNPDADSNAYPDADTYADVNPNPYSNFNADPNAHGECLQRYADGYRLG
jgi:hypothetical protein